MHTAELASGVALVAWPDGRRLVARLAAAGAPRLLLVAPQVPPPPPADDLQDWVRLPADPVEVQLRTRRLARLAGERRA